MRRKRSATLRLPVPPGSRGIRKVSWAPRPVRDVSRLGARHGQEPGRRTDHSEIKANRRVPSMGQLGRKSSKRVQPGEPNDRSQHGAQQRKSLYVFSLPLGRMRIPNRSSPRMTGSTAISGSCERSHVTTRGSGAGFVGPLRTPASTRHFTALPSTQSRSGRRSPSADSPVASQRLPRSAEPRAG